MQERDELFSAWRLFFERLADHQRTGCAALRGHAMGGYIPPRVHRIVDGVVAQPPALRGYVAAARSWSTIIPRGAPASEIHLGLPRATRRQAMEQLLDSLVPGFPTSSASRSFVAPKASRCMPSRRCGCCSIAACSNAPEASTG